MTFNSSELLSHVMSASGGYARPHHFEAIISPPAALRVTNERLRRVSLNCSATVLPGRTFATQVDSAGGAIPREHPHTPIFSPLPLTFYVSDDMAEKEMFDRWQDLVYEPGFGALEYYDNYVGQMVLHKVSRRGEDKTPVQSYRLVECWPRSVGDVTLGYEMGNQICMLPVTVNYHQWFYDLGTQSETDLDAGVDAQQNRSLSRTILT